MHYLLRAVTALIALTLIMHWEIEAFPGIGLFLIGCAPNQWVYQNVQP